MQNNMADLGSDDPLGMGSACVELIHESSKMNHGSTDPSIGDLSDPIKSIRPSVDYTDS